MAWHHSIKHAMTHSSFVNKHPILTFTLACVGLSTLAKVATNATAKSPSTSQPIQGGA